MSPRILIIEDDEAILRFLRRGLAYEGYTVDTAADGQSGLTMARDHPPDLVVLDWMLPGLDGLEVCRRLRAGGPVPILMLTAKDSVHNRVQGLDAGADDYLTKPFKTPELLARVLALVRRRGSWSETKPDRFSAQGFLINFDSQEVWSMGNKVDLTPTEYALLKYLIRNRGQVLTYRQLLTRIYPGRESPSRHDLFVHISRLRKKIEREPNSPRLIHTRWGVGYFFSAT